jgi:hypothetical protein
MNNYERSCNNKKGYPSKRKARIAMENLEVVERHIRKTTHAPEKVFRQLNIYYCDNCGCWHIGHVPYDGVENHDDDIKVHIPLGRRVVAENKEVS